MTDEIEQELMDDIELTGSESVMVLPLGGGRFRLESDCMDATISIEPGGDSHRVRIAFAQPANGIESQAFEVNGAWEWEEFVKLIRDVDLIVGRQRPE